MPPGTVQCPSVLLSWGGDHFHPTMPAVKALQADSALASHPCHHTKFTVSFETSACVNSVFALEADKTLQRRSDAVKPPDTSIYSVKVLTPPPQSQSCELKPFSARHCWTLSTVMDAQILLGARVEACPEQLAGTKRQLLSSFSDVADCTSAFTEN